MNFPLASEHVELMATTFSVIFSAVKSFIGGISCSTGAQRSMFEKSSSAVVLGDFLIVLFGLVLVGRGPSQCAKNRQPNQWIVNLV